MGYETLCYALYDQRDLVEAIRQAPRRIYQAVLERDAQFERVKIIWGSDDMGFKTGPLFCPDDMREFVLPGHKRHGRDGPRRGPTLPAALLRQPGSISWTT